MKSMRWLVLPLLVSLPLACSARAGENPGRPVASPGRADKPDKVEKTGKTERASSRKPALKGTVNLNTADEATLELLPGVGPRKAERILAFRHAHPFRKIEELTRVRGFGRKTLMRLKPYLSISGPSTLGAVDGPEG